MWEECGQRPKVGGEARNDDALRKKLGEDGEIQTQSI